MADDKLFGKGIGLAAGFDLGAQKPLDSRLVVNTIAERDEHVTGNRAYEGMLVYVKEDKKTYQLSAAGAWEEFGFNDQKFQDGVKDVADELRGDFEAADTELSDRIDALEGLVMGGEGEGLEAILGDVAELKGAVGVPAEEGQEATGFHKAIADLKAKDAELVAKDTELEQAIEAVQALIGTEEEGTVGEQIQGAVAPVQEAVEAVDGRVDEVVEVIGVPAGEGVEASGMHKVIADADAAVVSQLQGEMAEAVEALEGADTLIQGRLDALELVDHEHANQEVLDGITADKVTAWDAKATAEDIQGAKDYADEAVAALVGSAHEDLNTIYELAQAIQDHGDVYEAYVTEVNGKLDGKVDKVEGSRLVSEEEIAGWNAKAEVSDVEGKVAAALQEAKDHANGKDAAIQAAKDAADAAQEGVDGLVAVVGDESEGLIKDIADAKALGQQGIDDAATAKQAADKAQEDANKGIQDAATAQAAAVAAQGDVDALAAKVGEEGEQPTGLFAEIAALKAKDAELVLKDNTLEGRINTLEAFFNSGDAGDGEISGLGEIQASISELKGAVGAPAVEGGEPATGLFADIAALQAKDTALQGAIDAEVARAQKAEGDIRSEFAAGDSAVLAKVTEVDTAYKAADAALEEDIAALETEINTLKAKDSTVEADIKALQEKVGVEASEGVEASGLFAEIAALKAKEDLTPRVVALETGLTKEAETARAAEKANADAITALRSDMIATFAKIETEVKDGMVITALVERDEEGNEISSTPISEKPVDVMTDEDAQVMLENIFAPVVEE